MRGGRSAQLARGSRPWLRSAAAPRLRASSPGGTTDGSQGREPLAGEPETRTPMRRIDGHPLWIGTARDARAIKEVLDAGIEAIVDLAVMCEPVKPPRELVYLRFPLADGGGNPPWLICAAVHAVEGLVRLGVPTLVACDGGMSRSVVIATAALWARTPEQSPDDVLRRITEGGPADVHPALWNDVKRYAFTVTEAAYLPRE